MDKVFLFVLLEFLNAPEKAENEQWRQSKIVKVCENNLFEQNLFLIFWLKLVIHL